MKPISRIMHLSRSSLVAFAFGALIGLPSQALGVLPGDLSPSGAPDGVISMPDALRALRIVVGLETPTSEEIVTGDVAPLLVEGGQVVLDANGQVVLSNRDGRIGIGDAVVLARAGIGAIRLPEISPLDAPRAGHTATLLPNGQVLVTGGNHADGLVAAVECFDPATRAFNAASARLTTARTQHTATLLPDQNTLLVAGRDSAGPTPVLDQIRLCGAPTSLTATLIAREEHAAVLLADGTLLITGGRDANGTILATAERYNPRTQTFTPLGSMTSARAGHSATLLPDGMVLIVGGVTSDTAGNSVVVASAERFDPTTGVFTPLSTNLTTPRTGHTATLLPDGTVLILGGADATPTVLASAETFDPSSGSFSPSPLVLREARADHTATLLPDGRLVIIGGRTTTAVLASTELIGPQTDETVPTLRAVIPPDGGTGVAPNSMVAMRFSEPLRMTSVSNAGVRLAPEGTATSAVEGTVTPAESGLLAFFTPSAPLEPGTTYTLTLGPGITDTAGNPLATIVQNFTTQVPTFLTEISVTPADPTIRIRDRLPFTATGRFNDGTSRELGSAGTAPITLFNTGVAADGTLLPGGSVDPHYSLISSADPRFPGPNAVVADPIPAPFWFNDGNSQYIAPDANQHFSVCCSSGPGPYVYRTTFDLTGVDPNSVVITGQWRSDDESLIILNGTSTGLTTPTHTTTSFTISSGFRAGINTLDFQVSNSGGGPSGVRVDELIGTATASDPFAVTWGVDNQDVASIDATGLASGLSPGTTIITATSGTISGSTSLTVNAPPVAQSQDVTTAEDAGVLITLGGTDADLPAQTLTVRLVSCPANGTLDVPCPGTVAGNQVTYTPAPNFNGQDSVTFSVNDGIEDSNVAAVSIAVTPVNDPPAALDDSFTVAENSGATALDVLANDTSAPDAGETLTILTPSLASAIPVTINFDSLSAMPNAPGSAVPVGSQLSNQLQPTTGAVFNSAAGYVAVVDLLTCCGPNHAISNPNGIGGVNASGQLSYGTPISVTFFDPGNPLVPTVTDFVQIRGDQIPTSATASLEAFDVFGSSLGSISANDVAGGLTLTFSAPGIHSVQISQDSGTIGLDNLSFNTSVTQGSNGAVAITGNGTGLTYTPALNFFGSDSFSYTINDGTPGSTASATVSITVTPGTSVLSVSLIGNGSGSVVSTPPAIACPSTCSAGFTNGTIVSLTAEAAAGSIFAGWSGACGGIDACMITISEAASVTASFTPDLGLQITLADPNFSIVGMTSAASLGIPPNLGALMLAPNVSNLFAVGASENSSAALYAVPVTRDAAGLITGLGQGRATFAASNLDAGLAVKPGSATLFFTRYPSNVLSERVGSTVVDFPLSNSGVPSSVGGLAFVPPSLPNGGELLVGSWSSGQIYMLPLTDNGDGTFTPGTASLFVDLPNGAGGGMAFIPAGPRAGDLIFVNWSLGTIDILDIDPATGLPVGGALNPSITPFASGLGSGPWGIAFDPVSHDLFISTWAGNPSNVIIQIRGFGPPSPATVHVPLTVAVDGTGAGTVTSEPLALVCPADCQEEYLLGSSLTLIATPSSGSVLTGWSGDCEGTGPCAITMDSAKSVTATFVLNGVPTAGAGLDQVVEATSPAGAAVTLDGSGSTDPDGDSLTYVWRDAAVLIATGVSPTLTLPLGSHTITLTVTDPAGATGTDAVVITVQDTTAPTLTVPPAQRATASGSTGAIVDYPPATASDAVDPEPTVACTPPSGSTFPVGTNTVTCAATDASGNTANASFEVTVVVSLVSIAVSPSNPTVNVGVTEQFTAAGTFSDGSTQQVLAGGTTLPLGLVSWLPGDGNTNDIIDGNHGTLQNGATFAAGKVGQAFSFDGVDDEVVVAHDANQNTGNQITIDAWVNPSSSGHGRPIAQKRSSSNVGGYTFETTHSPFGADNGLQFIIWIGGTPNLLQTPPVLTIGAWQHVAATYNGTAAKIYVNGVEKASTPVSGVIDGVTDPFVIGRNVVIPSFAWHGFIDEVEFYDRALSETEIQAIFNAGSAGKCKPGATCVTWESSAPGVASIDQTGLATGLNPGSTTITATSDSINGSATLAVNAPPVANAGPDQTVGEGVLVTLDGNGSSDPNDGDPLIFTWTQTAGPPVTLSDSTTAGPTFTSPTVTQAQTLTFRLEVSDGRLTSADDVTITVTNTINEPPVANAGPDQTVAELAPVTLDGGGSFDPNGDPTSFNWRQTAGTPVTLTGANTSTPTFTAPGVSTPEVLTFELIVSDPFEASATDTVAVTVADTSNQAPALTALSPPAAIHTAPSGTNLSVTFDQAMRPADATTFIAHGSTTGRRSGVYSGEGTQTLTFDPTADFKPGEEVQATLTTGIQSQGLTPLARPFVWKFRTAAGSGPANFGRVQQYPAGLGPLSLAAGDFNRDGETDLAVANADDNTISVHLNLGDGVGAFGPGEVFNVGIFPSSVVAGDLDNDGDVDLAAVAFGDPSTSDTLAGGAWILRNNGDGTFTVVSFFAGPNPESVEAADLDGDGDLDLATAHSAGVSILFNLGDATFQAPQPTSIAGVGARWLTSGDFDNDGDLDLAVAPDPFSERSIAVLFNNGLGSFGEPVDTPNPFPGKLSSGDLDGDGDLDLVVATFLSSSVTVMMNNGDGTFAEAVSYFIGTCVGLPPNPCGAFVRGSADHAALADVDGDGDLDVAVANRAFNAASLLLNVGDGTFGPSGSAVHYATGDAESIVAADFDGDGDLDLATANSSSDDFSILLNSAPGEIQFSLDAFSVSEDGGTAAITVSRTGGSEGTVTVDFTTAAGTATAGEDYTVVSTTLTFDPGVTIQTVNIPILNDNRFEGDETVSLTLSNPTGGATLGTPQAAILTIAANDQPVSLVKVSGDGQTSTVDTSLPQPFVVRANDSLENPVSGVTVFWGVAAGGGSVAPSSSVTDANGLASATGTLGPTAGSANNAYTASTDFGAELTFTASANSPQVSVLLFGGGPTGTDPLPAIRVIRHDPDTGAVLDERFTDDSGVADFGAIAGERTTISIITTDTLGSGTFKRAITFANIPSGNVSLNLGLVNPPALATVDATLTNLPADATQAQVNTGRSSIGGAVANGTSHITGIDITRLQPDLKFSLLGEALDSSGAAIGCGSLADLDPSVNNPLVFDVSVSPALIPFTATEPVVPDSIRIRRKGLIYDLFHSDTTGPAVSGAIQACSLPEAEGIELSLRTPETTTSAGKKIGKISSTFPTSLDVRLPDVSIDALSRSTNGTTVQWTSTGADLGKLDFALSSLLWITSDNVFHRIILGPGTATSLALPDLPADLSDLIPPSTAAGLEVELGGLDTVDGFDDLIQKLTDANGDFDFLTFGATESISVERRLEALTVTKQGSGSGVVISDPQGIDCGTVCSSSFPPGSVLTLTAQPDDGSTFAEWIGCDTVDGASCTLTLEGIRTITAIFELQSLAPILVDGGTGVDSSTCGTQAEPCKTVTQGLARAVVGQTVLVGPGTYRFENNSFNPEEPVPLQMKPGVTIQGAVDSGGSRLSTLNFVFAQAGIVGADGATLSNFFIETYLPTVLIDLPDGATTLSNNVIEDICGCDNTAIRVSGSANPVISGNTIGIDSDGFLTAILVEDTAAPTIANNTITGSSTGILITASAAPKLEGNALFGNFVGVVAGGTSKPDLGGGALGSAGGNVLSCNATADLTNNTAGIIAARNNFWDHDPPTTAALDGSGVDIANFVAGAAADTSGAAQAAAPCYALTLTQTGTGSGFVDSAPRGILFTTVYPVNTQVTLTASPAADSIFESFSGDCVSQTTTCTLTILRDANVTVTFNFPTLTVLKEGTGTGTVSSRDEKIICGAACSASYPKGTQVTLLATASTGSAFAGWAKCPAPDGNLCLVDLNTNTAVSAIFNLAPALSINDVTVTEGSGGTVNAVFTVRLSAPSAQTVTVNYVTANNSATAGSDYVATSGTLTFSPGQTSRTITVQVIGDFNVELTTETFFVILSNATNATIADSQGVGTITDNDIIL